MSALFFGAALLALRSGLRLEYIWDSFDLPVSMKVAVANSSEMKRSDPNQCIWHISALSRSFGPMLVCNVTSWRLCPHLKSTKMVWGCFWWQIFKVFS